VRALRVALPLLLATASLARAEDTVAPVTTLGTVRTIDLEGKLHVLNDARVSVVVFLGTDCPISNKYLPDLADLAKVHSSVPVVAVISDPHTTRAQAVEHRKKFAIPLTEVFDATGELAALFKPVATPEAFVVKDGAVFYRGRIDDRWEKIGKEREREPRKDLAEAIQAALEDRAVTRETKAVGCPFPGSVTASLPEKITYARDVAPILNASCVSCHHEGGIGPFSLETYADAVKHAKSVVNATEQRIMPPWHAEQGFGHFEDERRLTDRQIATLAAWVKAQTPEGDAADLPPALTFAQGWTLGEPDMVVSMPKAYDIPARGRDIYRAFVIKAEIDEDKWVTAMEFKPGSSAVVHHCIIYLDTSGTARAKEEASEASGGYGYQSFGGPGFVPSGSLGGWAPGAIPHFLPQDTGRQLKKGCDIVLQMHYHPDGKDEHDQSRIALYFSKKPVSHPVSWLTLGNTRIDIPAGDGAYERHATMTLPCPITVIGVTPHMHLLGKKMKAVAELPSGETVPLINVTDWDFKWQDQYQYKKPFRLPEGTKIKVDAVYDNSADNPANPNDPPRRVRFGEQTTDEMCFCFLTVALDKKEDRTKLRRHLFESLK
jgi:hypothetical protein